MYEKAKNLIQGMEELAKEAGCSVDDVDYDYEEWIYDGGAVYEEEGVLDSWPYFRKAVKNAIEDPEERYPFPNIFKEEDNE